MKSIPTKTIGSGLVPLDELLKGLRLGDNVVWQVVADQLTRSAVCFLE